MEHAEILVHTKIKHIRLNVSIIIIVNAQIPGAESVSGSTYVWNIPSNSTPGIFKIRDSSATVGSLTPPAESANYFNITAGNPEGFITMEQPNTAGIS